MRPSPVAELQRVRARLTGSGYAWTRPRAAVLRVLLSTSTPLRAEHIHGRLAPRSGRRGVNLSSVYRTVNLLAMLGILRRVHLGDGVHRYELADDFRAHHHHILCEACGRIEDVRRCPLEGANLGVTVRSHSLELSGLCTRCATRGAAGRVRI